MTAPMVARVVATLSAVKMNGSALGQRTARNVCVSDAASERMSSSAAGSTWSRPRAVLIITGKKQSIAATMAFESWLSRPNQLLMSGAKAMIGIELTAIANGSTDSRMADQRAANVPKTSPPMQPMASPSRISTSV